MPIQNPDEYRAYMREYMRQRYHKKREESFQYLGNECAQCGSLENLEIDHIDPKHKSFSLAKVWSRKWEVLVQELDKCQLLCQDCHASKTKQDLHDIVWRNGWTNQYGSGPMH